MFAEKYKKYKNRYLNLKNKMNSNRIFQYVAPFQKNSYFEQTTDKMFISDPSYEYIQKEHEPGSRLMKLNLLLDNVAKGVWKSLVLINSTDVNRNAALVCLYVGNESLEKNQELVDKSISEKWEKIGMIGVDSGQAGIYDLKHYRDDSIVSKNSEGDWFDANSKLTLKATDYGGVIKYGAVSSSGYGDGMYNVYVLRDGKTKIIGVKIVFIDIDSEKL